MKYHPMLFSGPMVLAKREGRKRMTRRLPSKTNCTVDGGSFDDIDWDIAKILLDGRNGYGPVIEAGDISIVPRCRPGDRLWGREAFAKYQTVDYVRRSDGRAFSEVSDGFVAYRADGYGSIEDLREDIRLADEAALCEAVEIYRDRWLPSIHMPKWACRIINEVVEVRAERIQEISEEDARAEGVGSVAEFRDLWITLHGAESWEANPIVWAIRDRELEEDELKKAFEELTG